MENGYYDEGYVGVPFEKFRINSWAKEGALKVGAITIDEDGFIYMQACPKNYGIPDNVKAVKKIVEKIIKIALLKNLSLREIFDLFPDAHTFSDLYYAVDRINIEKIISLIKN